MHKAPIPDPDHGSVGVPDGGEVDEGSVGLPARHDNPLPDHNPS